MRRLTDHANLSVRRAPTRWPTRDLLTPRSPAAPGPIAADVVFNDVRGVNTGSNRLPQMYAGTVASLTMLPWRGSARRTASMMRW